MIQREKHRNERVVVERVSKHTPNSQWSEERIQQAFLLALLGYSDLMIAQAMNVHHKTLEHWKRTNPKFLEKLNKGKHEADMLVCNELYKNCFDRFIEEEEAKPYKGQIVVVKKKVFVQGNVKAQLRWLSLRQRGLWSEDPSKNIQFNQTNIKIDKLDLSVLSDQELLVLKKVGFLQISQGESQIQEPEDV